MEVVYTKAPLPGVVPAVPTAPAPQPAPAAQPDPTPEELEAQASQVMEAMGWKAPSKTPAAAPEKPAEPVPAAAAPAAPAPALTPEQIAAAAERGTKAALDKVAPPAPPAPAEPPFKMTLADLNDYKAIQYLEATDPKYAGMAEKFLTYVKALYAYQTEWLKNNTGQEFDADAAEHAEWFNKNQPDIDPDVIEEADKERRAADAARRIVEPRMQQEAAEKAFEAAKPGIKDRIQMAGLKVAEVVSEQFAAILSTPDGKPNINADTVAALEAADPVAKEVIQRIVLGELEPIIFELEKTCIPGLNFKLNPAANPVHAQIERFHKEAEKIMLESPADVRVQDGREFVTVEDYGRRRDAIIKGAGDDTAKRAKIDELHQHYFTMTIDDLEGFIAERFGVQAKNAIEQFDTLANKKFKLPPPAGPTPPPPTPTLPAPTSGKPRPPSIVTQSDQVTTGLPGSAVKKTDAEIATEVMFPR